MFLQVFSPYITGLWVFRQTDRSRSIQSLPYHLGLYKSIRNIPPWTLLGGSWVVISRVTSALIGIIIIVTLLITPLITTPERPSKPSAQQHTSCERTTLRSFCRSRKDSTGQNAILPTGPLRKGPLTVLGRPSQTPGNESWIKPLKPCVDLEPHNLRMNPWASSMGP